MTPLSMLIFYWRFEIRKKYNRDKIITQHWFQTNHGRITLEPQWIRIIWEENLSQPWRSWLTLVQTTSAQTNWTCRIGPALSEPFWERKSNAAVYVIQGTQPDWSMPNSRHNKMCHLRVHSEEIRSKCRERRGAKQKQLESPSKVQCWLSGRFQNKEFLQEFSMRHMCG